MRGRRRSWSILLVAAAAFATSGMYRVITTTVVAAAYTAAWRHHPPLGVCNVNRLRWNQQRWTRDGATCEPSASSRHRRFLDPCAKRKKRHVTTVLAMVRNIDLPEAVIVYGRNALCDDDNGTPVIRDGLAALIRECHDIQTAVIMLLESPLTSAATTTAAAVASVDCSNDNGKAMTTASCRALVSSILSDALARPCHVLEQTVVAPNPQDLLTILEDILVQPRPFGGSSGFGSKPADPERLLAPQHCVVFCSCIEQTRAARAVGMRVISINDDDDLADAVVFDQTWNDVGIDDIATPGSYWLNPPHPRDDEGNKVDPYKLVQEYQSLLLERPTMAAETITTGDNEWQSDNAVDDADDMDDDDIRAILADLAPLK